MRFFGLRTIALGLTGLTLTQLFLNCGELSNGFEATSFPSLELNHPPPKQIEAHSQQFKVGNRQYTESLLRDVFTSPILGEAPALEYNLRVWVYFAPAQFGGACDPYGSYASVDCGGDISSANLPPHVDGNTVRESFRIQFCENVLAYDHALEIIKEKIAPTSVAPSKQDIRKLFSLFYRGDAPADSAVEALVELNEVLAKRGESVVERWRAVAIQVCESPGWQLY